MAVEAERLLAVFEARFTSLEKALTKARADSSKTFTSIEKDASKAENALATVGSKGVPGIDKANKAIGRTRFETANLAAQFNDIGVQLAGGQSPFLIAIQQGSQINQVLGGTGAAGAVSMLGGAFASLINPVSLATIGLITAGGAAVQYFSSMMENTGPTEASLKEQANLIQRVAERWGEALPALKAYADELKRQQESSEAGEATQTAINAKWEEARAILPEVRSALGEVIQEMLRTGASSAEIDAVRNAFNEADRAAQDLSSKMQEGTATAADFERVSAAIAKLQANEVVSGFDAAAGAVERLGRVTLSTAEATRKLAEQQANLDAGPIGGETVAGGKTTRRRLSDTDFASRFGWDEYFNFPTDKDQKPTRDKAAAEAQRERDAVQDLIESLQFERSLIGLTAVEKEKANALRRAGTAATDEEAQQIMSLVEATYTHREALKGQEEAYQQLQRAGETAINGLITAMADGKIEAKELLSILLSVASQLLNSRGGGGGFGGLVSAILGGGSLPKFAGGTNFAPGGMAIVGEKGPELVNLPRGSQVIPNHRIGSETMSYSPSFNIDARGAQRGVGEEIRAAIADYDRGRKARLRVDLPDLRRRGQG